MSTKKVCICGHFGFGETLLNGQTIKTKIVTEQLEQIYGVEQVSKLDTKGGVSNLVRLPFSLPRALKNNDNVVIFPAQNGLQVIAPLLTLFNKIYKRKLHYVVIGGWLSELLSNKKFLTKQLKKFDGIYVETSTMKKQLKDMGFKNIYVMPNCKPLDVLSEDELVYPSAEPYKLCTFSRVMKEKGIEDAIEAVKHINEKFGREVFTLDIYGQVEDSQLDWFERLCANSPKYVTYGGAVDFDKSVEVLKDYFALLFPTRFFTEGIPGTIIDTYAAGVPVISSKWESFADMVKDGKTGIGYKFGKPKRLAEILERVCTSPEEILNMKKECIETAKQYLPENAVDVLAKRL
ncbi:MAG: glycosyltransferase [Clostridia bacterium]|nr:glycosyltransferase [Clostridia bacterium]